MLKSISLQLDERLLLRVDEVRGDVPRQRWIARVLERELAAGGAQVPIKVTFPRPGETVDPKALARGIMAQPRPLVQKKR